LASAGIPAEAGSLTTEYPANGSFPTTHIAVR